MFHIGLVDSFSYEENLLPFYKFPKEYLYERQTQIIRRLNQNLTIVAYIDEDNSAIYHIKFKNNN